ncbi:MAG: lysyl-tRNA synthetase, class II [Parcubacteria group bacterium Gr01-1014_2]|nr:MAG: lysyl-tRNA synthetase, class II [Parcubacteria group bacterium Gr01-1014_2]
MALEEIRKARLKKLENIKKAGIDPYPAESFRSHKISEALGNFDELSKAGEKITLAGRLMSLREHGGSTFADLKDGSTHSTKPQGGEPIESTLLTTGESGKIQLFFKKDTLGAREYDFFLENFDIGDFIEVSGILIKTKVGEETLEVKDFRMLAKTLLPLPEKWHGLQDIEERFRKRYLDILFNDEVHQKFILRFKIIDTIREFFRKNGFIEVETPVLQPLPGGATARPFKTHMNDLDMDLYLRVAPELYLKRLLVGGVERLFEIAKVFRNEGMDAQHNPEFTMLEAYAAYWNENDMMGCVENLMKGFHFDKNLGLEKEFSRLSLKDVLSEYASISDYTKEEEKAMRNKAKELGLDVKHKITKDDVVEEIFEKVCRPLIKKPTFVIDFPSSISPLSKKKDEKLVRRFNLIINGVEVADGWSEINDPLDQRERFEAQEKIREKGNEEAQRFDKDFIEALEYGMPPSAGVGIGIDRLAALLTDSHTLREIILFPTMKGKE